MCTLSCNDHVRYGCHTQGLYKRDGERSRGLESHGGRETESGTEMVQRGHQTSIGGATAPGVATQQERGSYQGGGGGSTGTFQPGSMLWVIQVRYDLIVYSSAGHLVLRSTPRRLHAIIY
jgi:hypothetical protein